MTDAHSVLSTALVFCIFTPVYLRFDMALISTLHSVTAWFSAV